MTQSRCNTQYGACEQCLDDDDCKHLFLSSDVPKCNSGAGYCFKCPDYCLDCSSGTECTECWDEFELLDDGSCELKCEPGLGKISES